MRPEVWLPVAICAASFLGTLAVVVVGFLYNNSRISDLRSDIDARLDSIAKQFDEKLLRVEGVIDARLSRIEDILRIRP